MSVWQDESYFMKHAIDRVSHITRKFAGGQGHAEAIAELLEDVYLEAKVHGAAGSIASTSRLLHFADFLKRSEGSTHPETDRYLRR